MLLVIFRQKPDGTLEQVGNKTYKTWESLEQHAIGFGGSGWTLVEDRGDVRRYTLPGGSTLFAANVYDAAVFSIRVL
jgi:hypothetical protein